MAWITVGVVSKFTVSLFSSSSSPPCFYNYLSDFIPLEWYLRRLCGSGTLISSLRFSFSVRISSPVLRKYFKIARRLYTLLSHSLMAHALRWR